MPSEKTMNLVTKIVGAVHMFAAFLKVKDLGTGARIFIYKTLYIPLSKAFPFSGVLGYAPHPIGYMHLASALELAAGLCLLLGKSPKTKQRGCFMMMPLALLACHAFFPDDLALVAQSLLYLAGMCYLFRYHRRQTHQKVN